MDRVIVKFEVTEAKALGEFIASLSAPNNNGSAIKFDVNRDKDIFEVIVYPMAY